ncbi:hypothetical protein [Kallotenue papyrolyticum]|uniref:hypothetical protein n=1 Tax=Kallotenue papyrolyticum TaxID=1325125 RepID=UPI00049255F1|nr:hypothetical protein [Kallotenue papyrolyticum]
MHIELIHIGLILDIGFALLALVLFRFARVLGGLLDLIHRPPLEVWLRLAGWILILGFSIPHYIAVAVFYPNIGDPRMMQMLWLFRAFSGFSLVIAAVLAFVPSYLYYRWTSQ